MGVKGLQFYIEKCCPSASQKVEIEVLVNDYRRRNNSWNEELVVVVDGSSCIRHLYGDLAWVGGGQLKEYGERALRFVQAFKELNVRLVFFFDGPTVEKKRITWVERRLSTLDKIYHVLDEISRGTKSIDIDSKTYFHLPPGLGQLSRVIFQIICGCEVFQSLTECDEEIAEYARSKNAFAILSQDSDFIILDGGQAYYLSMANLNMNPLTTRWYNRDELARSLKIHPFHLPLLATLMGNDIVKADDLRPFHLQMTKLPAHHTRGINFTALFPAVAGYIRSLHLDQEYLHNRNLMSHIAQRVFKDQSKDKDIRASLRSYDTRQGKDYEREDQRRQDHWSKVVVEARKRHVVNKFPTMVYAIMSGLPYESSTSIEDFRKQDIPCYAHATQPIRQRIYGILLQEKPLPTGQQKHVVAEWCMAGPNSLNEAKHVMAEPPETEHPGLLAIWNDDGRLTNIRWQLFVHSISPYLDVDRIRTTLPPHLVVPTLILYFINEQYDCLAAWEINAMLATAASLKHYSAADLARVPSDPISSRGIRVANLVMRTTFLMYFLLAVCGYPLGLQQTAPWLFFDGKLFQLKYMQAESKISSEQLCEHKVDVIEDFQRAQQIVFQD